MNDVREQEQQSGSANNQRVPHEEALDQRPVPFLGDELAAALAREGAIYIALTGMCRALGLGAQAQFQRIQRTSTLAKGLREFDLKTRGGVQPTNCLRVDKVALWLAGIEPSRAKPQFRTKIEAYQEELAPVATQVFMRVLGISPTSLVPTSVSPEIAAQVAQITGQIEALQDVVGFLREHLAALLALPDQVEGLQLQLSQAINLLEGLATHQEAMETQVAKIDERTQRLTPAHARDVREMVEQMVRETKNLTTPLTYYIIYGRLKHRFRVASYNEIADDCYADVMTFLRDELARAKVGANPQQGSLF